MNRSRREAAATVAALALLFPLAGCGDRDNNDSAARAATDALGIENKDGRERTTEYRQEVLVKETQEVIDRQTGEVLSSEETITPVTVSKEKQVETDVDVNVGETKSTQP